MSRACVHSLLVDKAGVRRLTNIFRRGSESLVTPGPPQHQPVKAAGEMPDNADELIDLYLEAALVRDTLNCLEAEK